MSSPKFIWATDLSIQVGHIDVFFSNLTHKETANHSQSINYLTNESSENGWYEQSQLYSEFSYFSKQSKANTRRYILRLAW